MHGRLQMDMRFSLLLCIMCQINGVKVRSVIIVIIVNACLMYLFVEEILIDFREIIGAHSGQNLAEIVWETMQNYGLLGKVSTSTIFCYADTYIPKVIAVVADNATNNDTMMAALEEKHKEHGIKFKAKDARCRCMPHTVHLAAMKVECSTRLQICQ